MADVDVELLRRIPLFAQLPDDQIVELAGRLRPQSFDPQQPIFWVGDVGTDFYVVHTGHVTLTCPDDAGREITLADLGPGHFFGEISLLDGGPRTATARSPTGCTLLALGRDEFLRFLQERPVAAGRIVAVLGARQREMLDKLRGVKNVNEVMAEQSTPWQKVADTIAAVSASQGFVLLHVVWFGGWMGFNVIAGEHAPDPYPFNLLTMMVSLEAIFLSIFVLVSQNRSGEKDRVRADLDYQVNLKAQAEIMLLHKKLDRLLAAADAGPVPTVDDGAPVGMATAAAAAAVRAAVDEVTTALPAGAVGTNGPDQPATPAGR
jgi:CRP/FNR family cyclic AMP-dependent transcriptional regulator